MMEPLIGVDTGGVDRDGGPSRFGSARAAGLSVSEVETIAVGVKYVTTAPDTRPAEIPIPSVESKNQQIAGIPVLLF
jgi:hypothetical protein